MLGMWVLTPGLQRRHSRLTGGLETGNCHEGEKWSREQRVGIGKGSGAAQGGAWGVGGGG